MTHTVHIERVLTIICTEPSIIFISDFADLMWVQRPYNLYSAYGESKLAMVLFTSELSRKYGGSNVISVSVHPGWLTFRYNYIQ